MHSYTETEEQWLRDNHGCGTYEELTARFRQVFNCDVTFHSIKSNYIKSFRNHNLHKDKLKNR